MMKLFKIWCSRCHTECIDIYSAITSFPIFLPNQPMLMPQRVCRIQCGWGRGHWEGAAQVLCLSFFVWYWGWESHLNSIWHAVGPEMLVVGVAEAPRNLAFSWIWVKIGFRASPGRDWACGMGLRWTKKALGGMSMMACWNWAHMKIQMSVMAPHIESLTCIFPEFP